MKQWLFDVFATIAYATLGVMLGITLSLFIGYGVSL